MNRLTKITRALAGSGALCLSAAVSMADSISPASFSATLAVGDSTTIRKTVTVTSGSPTTSLVDVFFLADTTGSMGGAIGAVQGSAGSIMTQAAALGNVAFGVGEYKDVGDVFTYRRNTAVTTTQATAQAAINLWGASGGGDYKEANLYALTQVATGVGADASGFRAGAAKIVVWFGDASGHDPRGGATLASTIAALQGQNVKVLAVDVGTMNDTGQATAIATATGGSYFAGINTSTIVATINSAISSSFLTYSSVNLDKSEAPAGVSVTYIPAGGYVGSFDRSITRTFDFDVTFTGTAPGTYDFNLYGTVDRGRVATEVDRIVVTGGAVPDSGSAVLLLGVGLAGVGLMRRKMARAASS